MYIFIRNLILILFVSALWFTVMKFGGIKSDKDHWANNTVECLRTSKHQCSIH